MACCSGWSGRGSPSVGQPDATQADSIAACLPEQFIASRSGRTAGREPGGPRSARAAAAPAGSRGRRDPARRRRASPRRARGGRPRRCASPAPMASSACERGVQPAASSAVAWTGLFDDRGRIGRSTAPAAKVTAPSASSTTSEPRWADSKKPERQTSTRTGLSGQSRSVRPSSASSAATSASPSRYRRPSSAASPSMTCCTPRRRSDRPLSASASARAAFSSLASERSAIADMSMPPVSPLTQDSYSSGACGCTVWCRPRPCAGPRPFSERISGSRSTSDRPSCSARRCSSRRTMSSRPCSSRRV